MKKINIKKSTLFMCLMLGLTVLISAAEQMPVERFALYVASSTGGKGRETLKYTGSDANKVASALYEIGGIKSENSMILLDPAKRDIEMAFDTVKKQVATKKTSARRTEFIFFYSGHSDESSLLLNNEKYSYPQLKKSLIEVNADVEVVMLDSCYSGNFVRTKGGSREKPFLFDDSTIVKGHAYLSSSSEFEASQEADSIQSSYFTYALVTGMRGAADISGDGKVSLNELYHFAFNDTLSRTEFSMAGPQHPSYNITLVGSGDLVLTDISQAESALILSGSMEGRFFIRNTAGNLVAEVHKIAGTDIALALSAGNYTISVVTDDTTAQKQLSIKKGERVVLDNSGFTPIARTETVSRGGEASSKTASAANTNETKEPFPAVLNIGLWPGAGFNLVSKSPDAIVSFNLLGAMQRNIMGMQFSIFSNIVTENMTGLQLNGIFNNTRQSMRGIQIAGLINLSGDNSSGVQIGGLVNVGSGAFTGAQIGGLVNVSAQTNGLQIGGLVNVATEAKGLQIGGLVNVASEMNGVQIGGLVNYAKKVKGAQIGLINIARESTGVSFGLLNFILDGIMSPAVFVDSSRNLYLQYQGGTKWFYTVYYVGIPWDFSGDYMIHGIGIGTRLSIGRFFSFDIDIGVKSYMVFKGKNEIVETRKEFGERISAIPSLRVSFNYSPFKHLSVFGGAAIDLDFFDSMPSMVSAPMKFGNSTVTAYPSFFVGLKF